jgi:glucosamine--fructose-6-phosphate aminotransferase (isomerizing)
MCGIVGCAGHDATGEVLLESLRTLEYRGYDSAGVALAEGTDSALDVVKRAGELADLERALAEAGPVGGTRGLGHTRWSTHGAPTAANAHPHTSADGRVAVVHNGIVENHRALRDELAAAGVEFDSDTDTEVIPNLVARALADGAAPAAAVRRAVRRLSGSYAVGVLVAGVDGLFAARHDSPLVLGVDDDVTYLASDVPALLDYTDRVVYLEDGDVAALDAGSWTVTDPEGRRVERGVSTVEWDAAETGKGGYDHYMHKEINEQPTALRQALSGRLDELSGGVELPDLDPVSPFERVHLVACGTSYHAACHGARLFRDAGVPARAVLANEYAAAPPPVGDDHLVVGVTQSGETADTLAALRAARSRGAPTLAVTNVVESSAARECDRVLYTRAGPEIGVAATKTFSAQLVALTLLAQSLVGPPAGTSEAAALVAALRDLPGHLQTVLDGSNAPAVVEEYLDSDAYFFVGRGYAHPVALEGALKFKEVTYEHAEGFAAGELKHGPLALVTERTPVFAVVTGADEPARKTVGNVKEAEARGAPVVVVSAGHTEAAEYATHHLSVPATDPRVEPVLANVQLQLVAYHTAARLGRPVDRPRNLAKSVTVE